MRLKRDKISALWVARSALLASIAIYCIGLLIGYPLGVLLALVGVYAMPVTALACVVIQLAQVTRRDRKSADKAP